MVQKYNYNNSYLERFYNLNYSASNFRSLFSKYIQEQDGLAVCLLDIRNFKYYNYAFGHEFGDAILEKVLKKIEYSIQKYGCVYRLGGNTLLILLHNVNSESDAAAIIDRAEL